MSVLSGKTHRLGVVGVNLCVSFHKQTAVRIVDAMINSPTGYSMCTGRCKRSSRLRTARSGGLAHRPATSGSQCARCHPPAVGNIHQLNTECTVHILCLCGDTVHLMSVLTSRGFSRFSTLTNSENRFCFGKTTNTDVSEIF